MIGGGGGGGGGEGLKREEAESDFAFLISRRPAGYQLWTTQPGLAQDRVFELSKHVDSGFDILIGLFVSGRQVHPKPTSFFFSPHFENILWNFAKSAGQTCGNKVKRD